MERLRRLLVVKEEELLESRRECADLKSTNVQLLNRAEVAEQNNRESAKRVEEAEAGYLTLTMESAKVEEELCRARTSEEGFQQLSKTLETQLSASEDALEKLAEDLATWKTRSNQYRQGYQYWKAKAVRYFTQLSFVPWLRDTLWSRGFHSGFENYRYLYLNQACFDVNLDEVQSNYLRVPQDAIDKMVDSCLKLFPDAPEFNSHGHPPTLALPPGPDGPEIDPSDDEGED